MHRGDVIFFLCELILEIGNNFPHLEHSTSRVRSSRSLMFFKIGVLKNFATKILACRPATLLKRDSITGVSL